MFLWISTGGRLAEDKIGVGSIVQYDLELEIMLLHLVLLYYESENKFEFGGCIESEGQGG